MAWFLVHLTEDHWYGYSFFHKYFWLQVGGIHPKEQIKNLHI
jgi:hypothetical protein